MKLKEKQLAIQMRENGLSYQQIKQKIHVSKGTLSLWLRDIDLTVQQKLHLFTARSQGAYKAAKNQQLRRIKKTEELHSSGKKEFFTLYKNPLFLSGLLLYWAEGDKHKQESVKFTNADPAMIALMMRWFREICKISEEKFRIALHIHTLHVQKNIINFWSQVTSVPQNQFHKPYIKKTSLGYRKNVLYTWNMCHYY